MTFDFPGYNLKLIQRCRCLDGSDHLFTYVYKFFSPVTGYNYVIRAEYHANDVFAVKFYCKKDRSSIFRYSKIINKGDLGNIMMTCVKVVPILLKQYPIASFCLAASRSVDLEYETEENYTMSQRYKLYCYMIPKKFGFETFEHFAYDNISCYLLRNKMSLKTKEEMEAIFRNTYMYLEDLVA